MIEPSAQQQQQRHNNNNNNTNKLYTLTRSKARSKQLKCDFIQPLAVSSLVFNWGPVSSPILFVASRVPVAH